MNCRNSGRPKRSCRSLQIRRAGESCKIGCGNREDGIERQQVTTAKHEYPVLHEQPTWEHALRRVARKLVECLWYAKEYFFRIISSLIQCNNPFSGQKQRRTSDRFEPYSPKPRDLQNLDTPLNALSQLTNNLNRTASSLRKSSESTEVKTVSQFFIRAFLPVICKQRHHLSPLLANENGVKPALSNRRCCTVPVKFYSVQVHKR